VPNQKNVLPANFFQQLNQFLWVPRRSQGLGKFYLMAQVQGLGYYFRRLSGAKVRALENHIETQFKPLHGLGDSP